jgi:hypothetical protein
MPTILSDHDVELHVEVLLTIWTSPPWADLWQELGFEVETLEGLELPSDMVDSQIWLYCQEHQIVLITGNRNAEGDDSLERASQKLNRPDSLPVLTIADPDRLLRDRNYARDVASQVLEYLFELDRFRGTRRLYVP